MKTLNSYYVEAEKIGGQSYLEGCLACATAYIVFLCMETRYEKVTKQHLNTPTNHSPTGKPAIYWDNIRCSSFEVSKRRTSLLNRMKNQLIDLIAVKIYGNKVIWSCCQAFMLFYILSLKSVSELDLNSY